MNAIQWLRAARLFVAGVIGDAMMGLRSSIARRWNDASKRADDFEAGCASVRGRWWQGQDPAAFMDYERSMEHEVQRQAFYVASRKEPIVGG